MRSKIYTQQVISGQKGINLIEKVVLDMGFVWNASTLDAGIDGVIEIRDAQTGAATNCVIQVQSKATAVTFQGDSEQGFEYLCDERDLAYWMGGNAPVILVCSHLSTGLSYWVSIKDYFKDPQKLKTRKILFSKSRDIFSVDCKDDLMQLAIPEHSGVYLSPAPLKETLYTNLCRLKNFPETIYQADTKFRKKKELWRALNELEDKRGIHKAYFLHEEKIYSFTDLSHLPWTNICKNVSSFPSANWSQSHDINLKRNFVSLLNAAFETFAYHKKILHLQTSKVNLFYFTPILDDEELPKSMQKSYNRMGRKSSQSICERYYRKSDKTILSYFRHLAFEASFYRFDGEWYLQIIPTYFFSHDGRKLHLYYEGKLKGKKSLDRAETVFSETLFWADVLTKNDGMFSREVLEFEPLQELPLDRGIKDLVWLEKEDDEKKEAKPYYESLF